MKVFIVLVSIIFLVVGCKKTYTFDELVSSYMANSEPRDWEAKKKELLADKTPDSKVIDDYIKAKFYKAPPPTWDEKLNLGENKSDSFDRMVEENSRFGDIEISSRTENNLHDFFDTSNEQELKSRIRFFLKKVADGPKVGVFILDYIIYYDYSRSGLARSPQDLFNDFKYYYENEEKLKAQASAREYLESVK